MIIETIGFEFLSAFFAIWLDHNSAKASLVGPAPYSVNIANMIMPLFVRVSVESCKPA